MIAFGTPNLIYWIILYPFGCLVYMIRNRRKLNGMEMKIRMGYYLIGYKTQYFFWEFLIMYRKMIFVLFAVLTGFPNPPKTIILLFVASVSLVSTMYFRPFALRELNILESYSNYTILVTIFAGCLYTSNINEEMKIGIFLFIILFNTFFSIKWLLSVIEIFVYTYEKKISRFCPFFLKYFLILKKTSEEAKSNYNPIKYWYIFVVNYRKNLKEYIVIKNN